MQHAWEQISAISQRPAGLGLLSGPVELGTRPRTCTEKGDRISADQTRWFLPPPPRAGGRVAALMNIPAGRWHLTSRGCVITSGEALWSRTMTQPEDCYMPADIWWVLHSRLHRGKPMLKVC